MEVIKIGSAEVFVDDHGNGKGKLTVSDTQFYTSSYYWGAMGCSMREFLSSINSSYFADKLANSTYTFCAKESVKNVRKFIRSEMNYDLPWYKFMGGQKELRIRLKELEECYSADHFVNEMYHLDESLLCFDLDYDEELKFKNIIKDYLTEEPWHFIGERTSNEYNYFYKLHSKLKRRL